jgi:nucleoside-diphosphate-sugar epimerase
MNVVVTGHHGYIGSVLVRVLAEVGHAVRGIDSFLYRDCDLGRSAVDVPALELDVRDVRAEHLEGADAVVHLAALSNDPLGALAPELTREVNLGGTHGGAVALAVLGVGPHLLEHL